MGYPNLQAVNRRLSTDKRGYTLVELAVTMAVILVLSTIGLFIYQSALAYARGTVCETNVRTLKRAVEEYSIENDAFPATLGQLEPRHLKAGYDRALEDGKWKTKISLFLIKMDASSHAHAQFLTHENLKKYGAMKNIFQCPADDDGSPSYGINAAVKGKRWSEIDPDEVIVADSDHFEFTFPDGLSKRHQNKAIAINKDGQISKVDDRVVADRGVGATDDEVTICHKPGTPAEKTMTVSDSELSGHLGHGDTIGACPSGK